jgi:hypothetical protein
MWNCDVNANIVFFSHYYILAQVVQKSNGSFFNLVCVGDPNHLLTNAIWNDVVSFVVENQSRPTLCMGDLKNIMHPVEKWGAMPSFSFLVQ